MDRRGGSIRISTRKTDEDAIRNASFYNVDPDTLLILYFHRCDHLNHVVDYATVFQGPVEKSGHDLAAQRVTSASRRSLKPLSCQAFLGFLENTVENDAALVLKELLPESCGNSMVSKLLRFSYPRRYRPLRRGVAKHSRMCRFSGNPTETC